MFQARKLVRSLLSHMYFLKEARDAVYLHSRRLRGVPHEREFYALRFVPDELPGEYVDVGANQGQSIESIKTMKPGARVVSFEPNPRLGAMLAARYRGRLDITVREFGLAEEAGRQTLFVPVYRKFVYDGDAALDRRQARALCTRERLHWFAEKELSLLELPCTLQRLDDQGLSPLFVKIDVQGHELEVVKGGAETIRRHEPILMIECLHDQPELTRLLLGWGYAEYVFDRRGFFRGESTRAINQLMMTPRRAAQVVRSRQERAFKHLAVE